MIWRGQEDSCLFKEIDITRFYWYLVRLPIPINGKMVEKLDSLTLVGQSVEEKEFKTQEVLFRRTCGTLVHYSSVVFSSKKLTQSAGVAEYTDCFSAEG